MNAKSNYAKNSKLMNFLLSQLKFQNFLSLV
jgi:hypothetical protein